MVVLQNVDLSLELFLVFHQFHLRLSKTDDLGFQSLDVVLRPLTVCAKQYVSVCINNEGVALRVQGAGFEQDEEALRVGIKVMERTVAHDGPALSFYLALRDQTQNQKPWNLAD